MADRSKRIFGNDISKGAARKAEKSKQKFIDKFGDDSESNYPASLKPNACLEKPLGVYDIRIYSVGHHLHNDGHSLLVDDTCIHKIRQGKRKPHYPCKKRCRRRLRSGNGIHRKGCAGSR